MIIIGFTIIGIGLGMMTARKRKGTRADQAQYAAGYGIAFALLGLLISIVLERTLF